MTDDISCSWIRRMTAPLPIRVLSIRRERTQKIGRMYKQYKDKMSHGDWQDTADRRTLWGHDRRRVPKEI